MLHALLLAVAVSLSPSQIDTVLSGIEQSFHSYIFPDVAARTVTMLQSNTRRYEMLSDPKELIVALNSDLYASTHDKHVHVSYQADMHKNGAKWTQAQIHRWDVLQNYGFQNVRRLPGNVGYLDFAYFSDDGDAGRAIQDAMGFVADTDALIIDLRNNQGGSPRAAETLEAYFFGAQQQVTSLILRDPKTGKISETQQYTAATVPGPLYLGRPIFLLTSGRTFSCAEQFVYDLRNLKRVTIVGQTTGGGANPGGAHIIGDHFFIFIPDGRAYSNITKTNWEGTGIAPDVPAQSASALITAYKLALQHVGKYDKDATIQLEVSQALADPAKALSP